MNEHKALEAAIEVGCRSPCRKSQQGVVIFSRVWGLVGGASYNAPPTGFICDGSEACRAGCDKVAIHADQAAILSALRFGPIRDLEMLHVKVVDGKAIPSGSPSCPDCSKLILESGLAFMWLLETGADGSPILVRYTAHEFHAKTLKNCNLPAIVGWAISEVQALGIADPTLLTAENPQ